MKVFALACIFAISFKLVFTSFISYVLACSVAGAVCGGIKGMMQVNSLRKL